KTALLQWFADHAQAAGSRVVRATGVEFEAELPYGCLSDIVSGLSDRADRLDEHHRRSLERAVGLDSTGPPGLVLYVAALALLRATGRVRPLVLVVDDAHWIDQCSLDILLFCARRLHRERVALVFAARDAAAGRFTQAGCSTIVLTGLDRVDAGALVDEF